MKTNSGHNQLLSALKPSVIFSKDYSEKDFDKDCVKSVRLFNLLKEESSKKLLADFWIKQANDTSVKVGKKAKNILGFFVALSSSEKKNPRGIGSALHGKLDKFKERFSGK